MSSMRHILALIACLSLAVSVRASDTTASPDGAVVAADADDSGAAQDTPQKKMIKTQFKLLRFQEDWRGLKDPDATTDHWLPAIKQIELAEDWDLSLGGQVRYQVKDQVNRNLLGNQPGHVEYSLLRTRLHGDLRIQDDARVFVEMLGASIHGNSGDPPPLAIDRQNWDFLNAFIEFIGSPEFKFRVGRTEMLYGAQRLIGPADWKNTRQNFDGGVLTNVFDNMSTDVFLTHPVVVDPRNLDENNSSRLFSGVYNTWSLEGGRAVDAYLFNLNDDDPDFTGGNGTAGDLDLYTVGGRFAGKAGPWDWDGEAAMQRGHFARDTIRASMWAFSGGHTLGDLPGAPRIGLDLDWASGDGDSTDGTHETFNQLFPSAHAFFGYLDLVGRQNIVSVKPNMRWKLGETAWFRAAWMDFNLQNDSDSLYNSAGAATLTDTGGASGNHVGHEWDFTLGWNPGVLAPHSDFQVGYSYLNPGDFVDNLGAGPRPKLLYFQYTFTF